MNQSMNTETLEVVNETPNLETMERADTLAIWNGYRESFEKLKASVNAVLSSDPADTANSKLARVNRLQLRQIRIAVENKRKELGEGYLRKKQAVDAAAKELKELIEPYEDGLLKIEEHAQRLEEERIHQLAIQRIKELSKFTVISTSVNYGTMTEVEFERILNDAKTLHELRQAEAKRAEEARIAKEKAEAEERERIRIENERLKKEALEREKAIAIERQRVENERKAAEEKSRKEREAIEAKARAEQEELLRQAREKQEKLDQEAKAWRLKKEEEAAQLAAKLKAEKDAAEKKAAEEAARLRAIADKERKEREAAEAKIAFQKAEEEKKRAAEEAARKEAELAPDREKIRAFGRSVRAIPVPAIKSEKGRGIIRSKLDELADWAEKAAANLKSPQ